MPTPVSRRSRTARRQADQAPGIGREDTDVDREAAEALCILHSSPRRKCTQSLIMPCLGQPCGGGLLELTMTACNTFTDAC